MPYTGIATSDREIKANPARVKRVLRAVIKSHRYLNAYQSEVEKFVKKRNKKTPVQSIKLGCDAVQKTLTKDGTVSEAIQRSDVGVRAEIMKVSSLPIRLSPTPTICSVHPFS